MSKFLLEAAGIRKGFGGQEVLKGVDLAIRPHEATTLIGPSGSGKSTLLRCLNLLERPEEGRLLWEGEPFFRAGLPLPKADLCRHRTRAGMVFQHFHLFPHRRVRENVAEGPKTVLRVSSAKADRLALELLERVGLSDKADAWPAELSGGQKQRVAIARALAMEPQVLLLDEVTSALDVELVAGVNDLLAELARDGMTMVVVTHDLGFARRVSHRICFLDEGEIVEQSEGDQVIREPKTERARAFMAAHIS